ncbi:glycerol-3-phosphate 1-O-acyltransferase PlsY [Lacticigenium naphthae]|uniref:glycerol-3-phosphate 1-O-acyltransferase PlsY n=1 Tax=Lacticigenium naphthae TaxID=515351 RepID=UPI0003FB44B5|nr:glycerol-3-phosphate 1-O-acyltransferase PlsY [Lacticigenium naphthae]
METVILVIIAYLLGSIPSGVWIGKAFYKKDIRKFGSGNSGTTNTFRVLGKKAGFIVFFADFLKGTLAALLPLMVGSSINPMLIGLAAIIGHVFPLFAGFKGGKAVATSAGVAIAYQPSFVLIMLVVFFIILYLSSMVSLASVLSLILAAFASLLYQDWLFSFVVFLLMFIVLIRHTENIKRIFNGEESRISFGLGLGAPKKKE